MTFTLRQLRFLTALADAGSFRAAAEHCLVTQPTMSAGIKELENALGAILVDRTSTGALLTPAGERAVARARKLIADADDLAHAVQHAGEILTGRLRLGIIPTIAPYILPKMLNHLSQNHKGLALTVREDITNRLTDDLRTGALDAAIIALPVAHQGVEIVTALDDEFLLAAPEDHPILKQDHLTPADIPENDLLLLADGHCLRDHVLTACATHPNSMPFAATSFNTLIQMVAHGQGITLAPQIAVNSQALPSKGVTLRHFTPPVIGRQIGVAWRQNSPRAADARALGDVLAALTPACQTTPAPRP